MLYSPSARHSTLPAGFRPVISRYVSSPGVSFGRSLKPPACRIAAVRVSWGEKPASTSFFEGVEAPPGELGYIRVTGRKPPGEELIRVPASKAEAAAALV